MIHRSGFSDRRVYEGVLFCKLRGVDVAFPSVIIRPMGKMPMCWENGVGAFFLSFVFSEWDMEQEDGGLSTAI